MNKPVLPDWVKEQMRKLATKHIAAYERKRRELDKKHRQARFELKKRSGLLRDGSDEDR